MNKDDLIKLKYSLECERDKGADYKGCKYYTIVNPSKIIYIGNSIISLFRLERDLDTDKFIKVFEETQEKFIRDSIGSEIIFDRLDIDIYYLLLVDKLELDMRKRDYEIEGRGVEEIPKVVEFLDDIVIVGRVEFSLYDGDNKVGSRCLNSLDDGYDHIVSYREFKDNMVRLGYDNFRIGNFEDLGSSVYDDRRGRELLSLKFRKNKIRIRDK